MGMVGECHSLSPDFPQLFWQPEDLHHAPCLPLEAEAPKQKRRCQPYMDHQGRSPRAFEGATKTITCGIEDHACGTGDHACGMTEAAFRRGVSQGVVVEAPHVLVLDPLKPKRVPGIRDVRNIRATQLQLLCRVTTTMVHVQLYG